MTELLVDVAFAVDDGSIPSEEACGHGATWLPGRRQLSPLIIASKREEDDNPPGHGDSKLADTFLYWPHGFQPRMAYEHPPKYTDIMAVSYNARMHHFVLLDAKGVTTWSKDAVHLSGRSPVHLGKYRQITWVLKDMYLHEGVCIAHCVLPMPMDNNPILWHIDILTHQECPYKRNWNEIFQIFQVYKNDLPIAKKYIFLKFTIDVNPRHVPANLNATGCDSIG